MDRVADDGPGWVPVAATVAAQLVWLVLVVYAWVIAVAIIAFGGGAAHAGSDSVGPWIVITSAAALALAPVPTVAYVLSRRGRRPQRV